MSPSVEIKGFDLPAFVAATLAEDLGEGGDVTSAATIPADARLTATMASRDAVTLAGLPLAEMFFRALDPACTLEPLAQDGQSVVAGTPLLRITGNARAVLSAERSALNTVQHLTGIATLTRAYVDAIAGTAFQLDIAGVVGLSAAHGIGVL
jgi:nicotinate-nucleotide pyrophosphorylase (carboxylating)